MKKNMGEKGRKLMDAIKADKKITLIVCIGLLGMLLLLASEFIDRKSTRLNSSHP